MDNLAARLQNEDGSRVSPSPVLSDEPARTDES